MGSLRSPKLLMLSGIGNAETLRKVGVTPVHHLPGVGQNLHDHTRVPIHYASEKPIPPTMPGLQAMHAQFFWYTDARLPVPRSAAALLSRAGQRAALG